MQAGAFFRLEPWIPGPLDLWAPGPLDPWTPGSWTPGPLDPWTTGPPTTLNDDSSNASRGSNYSLCLVLTPLMSPNRLLALKVHSSYASWGSNYTLMSSTSTIVVPKTALNPKGLFLLCKVGGSNYTLL